MFSMQVSHQQLSREKSGLLDGSVDILIESNIQETSVTFSFAGLQVCFGWLSNIDLLDLRKSHLNYS